MVVVLYGGSVWSRCMVVFGGYMVVFAVIEGDGLSWCVVACSDILCCVLVLWCVIDSVWWSVALCGDVT